MTPGGPQRLLIILVCQVADLRLIDCPDITFRRAKHLWPGWFHLWGRQKGSVTVTCNLNSNDRRKLANFRRYGYFLFLMKRIFQRTAVRNTAIAFAGAAGIYAVGSSNWFYVGSARLLMPTAKQYLKTNNIPPALTDPITKLHDGIIIRDTHTTLGHLHNMMDEKSAVTLSSNVAYYGRTILLTYDPISPEKAQRLMTGVSVGSLVEQTQIPEKIWHLLNLLHELRHTEKSNIAIKSSPLKEYDAMAVAAESIDAHQPGSGVKKIATLFYGLNLYEAHDVSLMLDRRFKGTPTTERESRLATVTLKRAIYHYTKIYGLPHEQLPWAKGMPEDEWIDEIGYSIESCYRVLKDPGATPALAQERARILTDAAELWMPTFATKIKAHVEASHKPGNSPPERPANPLLERLKQLQDNRKGHVETPALAH